MNQNKLRVALYMGNMSVPDKISKSRRVQNAILSKPSVFAAPGTALSELATETDALETAWNDALDGGKTLTAIMHDQEGLFDAAMLRLALYVELTAKGDPRVVHFAGLDVRPAAGAVVQQAFEARHGNGSGHVRLKVKAVAGASYLWQYSTDNVSWTDAGGTKQSSRELEGLSAGSRYWFRFAIIDKDGQQAWSEALSLIVV